MLSAFLAFLLGAAAWTLVEYLLHRYVFHASSAKGPGAKEHRRHHVQVSYFAPWWQKALAAVAATAILLPVSSVMAGTVLGATGTLGFVMMYLLYEVLHRRAHTHAPRTRYGRWQRKHHFAHHFSDPRQAHGVTTPFWDIVFGTHLAVDRVRVPRRLAMTWLLDDKGGICPQFTGDYVLVGAPAREDP